MKIQLASDLHLEFLSRELNHETLIRPMPEADVLVLAGDVHLGIQAVECFKNWPVPVLYLAGNHEFYARLWEQTRKDIRQACRGTSINFLDNDRIDIGGVRFLGGTLWTDFRQRGFTQSRSMEYAALRLNDYRLIKTETGTLTAAQTLQDHEVSRQWLEEELAKPYEGKTVVITHHAPHTLSIAPRFIGDPLNAGFVSDLTELLFKPDLWLHGHVHDSFDYRVGNCRVVANPAGYIKNRSDMRTIRDAVFENTNFNPSCVLEVESG
jgi:Icc-related predicted phosphoesterase